MTSVTAEVDPNPKLERGPDEDCLATWWHQATPGTTYWRCLVPARHLPGQTLPLTTSDLIEVDGKPVLHRQKGDTAIWQFLGDEARSRVAMGMRELHGTRTLMELDDNYTRPAPYLRGRAGAPWAETIAQSRQPGFSLYSYEMNRIISQHVDGLIVATDYLADVYSEYNPNIWVCPNSVDPADWDYERPEPDGIFRIVYYGSPSHNTDAPLVTKALKWAAKQPGVEVWTVGFDPPFWSFPHQTIPWNTDLTEARKTLFKFDLGIAPLKGNPWSRAKSDIKALEYAMAGVLPLMSMETPFEPWFDKWPELLVSDQDWVKKIKFCVSERDDVAEVAGLVKDWVLETRGIENTIHLWRQALDA